MFQEEGNKTMKTENTERKNELALIWRHTHRDFKGKGADGIKRVLVLRPGGTTSVPLNALTDAEVADKLGYAKHKEEERLAKKAGKV